jgi:hypothetical protein
VPDEPGSVAARNRNHRARAAGQARCDPAYACMDATGPRGRVPATLRRRRAHRCCRVRERRSCFAMIGGIAVQYKASTCRWRSEVGP